ncbi:hypothetical protein [Ferrimonas balearica]|uniref:hypothetical protein n=1 Tax=Ferrimonas balearica TaxID=44012 RepID=UPI001C9992F5|nr:hypothetical protein [Ferrimonas balearica]MBY5993651.1 hypothetical protein [Ferrimonas balearica]
MITPRLTLPRFTLALAGALLLTACGSDQAADPTPPTVQYWLQEGAERPNFVHFSDGGRQLHLQRFSGGHLCSLDSVTTEDFILIGDPQQEERVQLEYSGPDGEPVEGVFVRTEQDPQGLFPPCDTLNAYNGLYEVLSPLAHFDYWQVSLPEATGYRYLAAQGCYQAEPIEHWVREATWHTTAGPGLSVTHPHDGAQQRSELRFRAAAPDLPLCP